MEDSKASATGWYSVREAADYLGISEPTVFRWMKDGSLSFFKVGNSTRFSKESLDAVIEKVTGRKEAEMVLGRCAACGHTVLLEGRLRGAGRIYFQPKKTKFWTLDESLVPTTARVCAACGYVQLHAEVGKLSRLQPERNGHDESARP